MHRARSPCDRKKLWYTYAKMPRKNFGFDDRKATYHDRDHKRDQKWKTLDPSIGHSHWHQMHRIFRICLFQNIFTVRAHSALAEYWQGRVEAETQPLQNNGQYLNMKTLSQIWLSTNLNAAGVSAAILCSINFSWRQIFCVTGFH